MQYKYTTCELPSNGLIYNIREVHLRAKTIFDIKTLLGNPIFDIRNEIDTLQHCIDPNDHIDVYDLVNQDVVYLLYKLRSMSDDNLTVIYNNEEYKVTLSELKVNKLQSWEPERVLPESKIKVVLAHTPIKNIFNITEQQKEFENKYPDYQSDSLNTVMLLNSIAMFDTVTNKDHIRSKLEALSFKDSLYLLDEIEKFKNLNFGIVEEIEIDDKKIPLQITEEFFRPTL